MNTKAKIALALPHNNKSGASMNSIVFMVAIKTICSTVLSRFRIPLRIHAAIPVSASPIKSVRSRALSVFKIRSTISW